MGDKEYLRGPWNAEGLWHLQFEDQAAWIVPPIAHLGNGPAGVAYYPGTGLDDRYRDHMFMCDYNGSAARTGVYAFRIQPRGASFEIDNIHKFLWGLSCSDVEFGYDGLYVSDWAAAWNPANKGRLYRVDNPTPSDRDAARATKQRMLAGMAERDHKELAGLLADPDQRVRLAAQLALVAKGDAGRATLLEVARQPRNPLARLHALWGLGIAGREDPSRLTPIIPLLTDPDAHVRAQTAKVLGDARCHNASDPLMPLLQDPAPHVRMLAATAIGKLGNPEAVEPLLEMLRDNADRDPYLRHAGVMGLVSLDDAELLVPHIADPHRSVRLGVLLALRRMEDERISAFLQDEEEQLVIEAARAINDVPIEGAREQLAALIEPYLEAGENRPPNLSLSEPLLRRILNANLRFGQVQQAQNLVRFLAESSNPDRLRRQAAAFLASWQDPGPLDRVVNLYRPLPQRDPEVVKRLLQENITAVLQNASPAIKQELIELLAHYELSAGNDILARWADDSEELPATRIAAMQLLAQHEDVRAPEIVKRALGDPDPQLRIAAGRILAQRHPQRAAARLIPLVETSRSLVERQQALATLGTLRDARVDEALAVWLDQLSSGNFPETLQLDLLQAAAGRSDPDVTGKLAAYKNSFPPEDSLGAYRAALHGGDYERGRDLFIGRMEVRCLRCHQVKKVGGTAGPPLTRVGIEQTREYLLESIVLPSAKISKGYETTVITTDEGRVISGIVQSEDDQWLQLLTPERQKIDIAVERIEDRFSGKSAMPEDMHKHLNQFDLRDLVEFLSHLGRRPQDR
jgi:quinoprotein glucose dehydrogenase